MPPMIHHDSCNKHQNKLPSCFTWIKSETIFYFVDWDLECYANWQQGDLTFMYGKFTTEDSVPPQDVFRCFVSIFKKFMSLFLLTDLFLWK